MPDITTARQLLDALPDQAPELLVSLGRDGPAFLDQFGLHAGRFVYHSRALSRVLVHAHKRQISPPLLQHAPNKLPARSPQKTRCDDAFAQRRSTLATLTDLPAAPSIVVVARFTAPTATLRKTITRWTAGVVPMQRIGCAAFIEMTLSIVLVEYQYEAAAQRRWHDEPVPAARHSRYALQVHFSIFILSATGRRISQRWEGIPNSHAEVWNTWLEKARTDPAAERLVNLIVHHPAEEIYDTQADPYELTNAVQRADLKPVLERLRKALAEWRQQVATKPSRTCGLSPASGRKRRGAHNNSLRPFTLNTRLLGISQKAGALWKARGGTHRILDV